VITLEGITERIRRLEQLKMGLGREWLLVKTCEDPLLYVERRDYMKAIRSAAASLGEARIVLVKVRQRMGGM
jgi:hypothetical protein